MGVFYTRQATYRDKEPLKKAEALAEIAGRVNAAEMEFVYEEYHKNIFPKTKRIGKVWTNPYTGWLYQYKTEGWICIRDWIEE